VYSKQILDIYIILNSPANTVNKMAPFMFMLFNGM